MVLTRRDCVKYPFTNEAVEYVKNLNVSLSDLGGEDYSQVLALAEKRVTDALTMGEVDPEIRGGYDEEILVYPAALMMIAAAGDERACRRYAMSEAKRACEYLRQETPEFLTRLAADTFGWDSKIANKTVGELFYEVALSYVDYLRNAVRIRDTVWKLTNRILERGYVYCAKYEFARLLEEEVEAKILSRISGHSESVPAIVAPQVDNIKKLVAARAQMYAAEETPKIVLAAAMPPCMNDLLSSLSTGKHVSHIGRFTITAFLSNIGATDEDILKMFHTQDDFSERIAQYQVEHISGSRACRKKYTPPSCKTMKTHSLCINPDQLCTTVAHPLAYYRRKARTTIASRRERPAQVPVQAPALAPTTTSTSTNLPRGEETA